MLAEKENGEEKGGKYFDKENIWSAEEKEHFWSAGEKKNKEEKGQEYLRKTNIRSVEEKNSGEGKGKSNDRQTTFPSVECTTFLIS